MNSFAIDHRGFASNTPTPATPPGDAQESLSAVTFGLLQRQRKLVEC